jgi:MFS family permease
MQTSIRLLGQRYFGPLFATQFLNAFNDNLFRTSVILLVIYEILNDPAQETTFSVIASALFILPFFLLSALGGQLADRYDKAYIIRLIKSAEIGIMAIGAVGIWLSNIPIMLVALSAMGAHSAFFGPIKYAILPQHLDRANVLGGTGLVEAGTYLAVLGGTIAGGIIPPKIVIFVIMAIAVIGRIASGMIPPAPPEKGNETLMIDLNIFRASVRLVNQTMHIRKLYLAIISISFFWAIGAVLAAQFPPLVKNELGADKEVASLFLAVFSIGIAIGSVAVNRLLMGTVSARYSPVSVLVMGVFVADLWWSVSSWNAVPGKFVSIWEFVALPGAWRVLVDLLGISIAGGMFVVPLYAFLTTTVAKAETARTVAANSLVNSGAMVASTMLVGAAVHFGLTVANSLLIISGGCLIAAWLAWLLVREGDQDSSTHSG